MKTISIFILSVITIYCFPLQLSAQQATDTIPEVSLSTSKVIKAYNLKTLEQAAGLGDYVKVEVSNIEALMQTANQRNQKIVLYFNEIPMHGIYANFISSRDKSLIFKLTRDTISMKSWNIYYQKLSFDSKKIVRISVGFENDGSLKSDVTNFSLILVHRDLLSIVLIGVVALLILFIILVKRTGIIRDDNSIMGKNAPYSLSRTQLAIWSYIIVFSFLFIYIITGEIPPITNSTLILITTSMATAAGAKVIESSKNPNNVKHTETSKGFWIDLISDHHSVSIHRFQMLVWTFILAIIFLSSVFKSLTIPVFDEGLLILMGASSGTYLGLKIPEKSPPTVVAEAPTPTIETEIPLEVEDIIHETPAVG